MSISKPVDKTTFETQFIEDGFIVIRNAVDPLLIKKIQSLTIETLCQQILSLNNSQNGNLYEQFCNVISSLTADNQPYKVLKPVWEAFMYHKIPQAIFSSRIIFETLTMILGKDLCFQDDPSLTLNIPEKTSSKKNYLFKEYHQEIWSGASIDTIQFFMPIFQTAPQGGISFVKGSHLWGHIPHRDRKPVEIPSTFEALDSDLQLGDVMLFHSMLLHKTTPLLPSHNFRLALPCLIRNFRMPNNAFENYRSWKVFSYSAQTTIHRKLGNHYLSPFRLIGLPNQSQIDSLS